MTAPDLVISEQPGLTEKQHNFGKSYYLNGEKLMGVTTVLSTMDKPALKQWAADCALEALTGKEPKTGKLVEGLDPMLRAGMAYTQEQLDAIMQNARGAFRDKSKKVKDAGSIAHDWIDLHVKGRKPEMPERKDARASVASYLELEMEHEIRPVRTEWATCHPAEKVVAVVDMLAWVDGRLVVLDTKTGKDVYIEQFYQAEVCRKLAAPLVNLPIEGAGILLVPKDGTAPRLEWSTLDANTVWIGFLGLKRFRDSLLANGWKPSFN